MTYTLRVVGTMEEKTPHDTQYFIVGKNKIIIAEHFQMDGETIGFILEKMILNAAKMPRKQ